MREPEFYLLVAKDLLNSARRALGAGVLPLAALGLVFSLENCLLSLISYFKPPTEVTDPVMELNLLSEQLSERLKSSGLSLEELVEFSQHVLGTYKELLTRGSREGWKLPSEVVTEEEVSELLKSVERVANAVEVLVASPSL